MLRSVIAIFLITALLFPGALIAQKATDRISIIPEPVSVNIADGSFRLTSKTRIISEPGLKDIGNYLSSVLSDQTGISVLRSEKTAKHSILIKMDPSVPNPEGYRLRISEKEIIIASSTTRGAFYGAQSLVQLVNREIAGNSNKIRHLLIPACEINDYPKYAYRGFHLDVSRHFFSKQYLSRLIDWLAYYKINTLHLHLTDDQGWRVEIDQFPLLTSLGAWRNFNNLDSACIKKQQTNPDFTIDKRFIKDVDGKPVYGGFYTKQDIREIIAYATDHYIEIIPEIDMPGHMSAAITAYPFLSCTGEKGWGKEFSYPICPCNEQVMDFCFRVWDEIAELFPSPRMHIGSDEVEKDTWESSPSCQQFMKDNGLSGLNDIQNYYVRQIQKHLEGKGKKVIAWDDVIEGKIDSNLTITYWRDWVKDSPLRCSTNGNELILTPWSPFYLSSSHAEKTLKQLYEYNPEQLYPPEVTKRIIGLQSCVWTEEIPSEARFEYLVFPNLQALSETCWSSSRDWDSFQVKLKHHQDWMDLNKINYRKSKTDK